MNHKLSVNMSRLCSRNEILNNRFIKQIIGIEKGNGVSVPWSSIGNPQIVSNEDNIPSQIWEA